MTVARPGEAAVASRILPVRARGLVKTYGSSTAVDGIDLEVAPGEAVGLLGPNGAGKSSTMRMIGCVAHPTSGTLEVLGRDVRAHGPAIRAMLGSVPQEDNLDIELTVAENLYTYGRYFGLSRARIRERSAALLDFFRLADRTGARVDSLSGGMRRRLTIARALINDPALLLLDEPTTGLDPQARHMLWERLFQVKQQGKALVLTTHYMDEAEQLCDRLVIMDRGRVVTEGRPAELVAGLGTRDVVELRFGAGDEDAAGKLADVAERIEVLPDRLLMYVHDGDAGLAAVQARDLRPEVALVRRSTLEDVFLRLTGRTLED